MGLKAVKPEELASGIVHAVPDFVIEAFNRLITKNFLNGRARITQKDAIAEIQSILNVSKEDIFKSGMLNVEAFYRAAGWGVEYDKPSIGDNYEAFFLFTTKKA